jgi:hypothetical protein
MQKRRTILVLSLVLLSLTGAYAQQPAASDTDPYKTIVAKLKGGDTKVDYKALRMASASSKAEDAGARGDSDAYSKAVSAYRAKKYDEALSNGEKALKTGYLDINTHLLMAAAHKDKGNKEKFEFHKAIYLGLVNSILDGADGESAKTAFVVIEVSEEYAILDALELERGSQGLRHEGGHAFDVLTATDPKTKKSKEVWFNIDIVWKGYEKMFK